MRRIFLLGLLTNLGLVATAAAQVPAPRAANAVQESLKKPADSTEGAAARIQQNETNTQARVEAIRYLGTVDCNSWPEAEKALCDGLLFDRNECVRFEAALALQRGCCSTNVVVKALTDCITSNSGLAERSQRVRCAAIVALSHCVNADEPVIRHPEWKGDIKKINLTPKADYYKQIQQMKPRHQVMDQARKALVQVRGGESLPSTSSAATQTAAAANTSERWPILDFLTRAWKGISTGSPTPAAQPTPAVLTAPVISTGVVPAIAAPQAIAAMRTR